MRQFGLITSMMTVIISAVMAIAMLSGCQKNDDTAVADDQTIATQTADHADDNSVNVQTAPITILALGDSLTEGLGVDRDGTYPSQLEDALDDMGYDNVTVVNSGLSGETSTGLVNRLDWVAQTNPDITILTIGANDAIRGLDVATVESNIREAVDYLQANDSKVILGGMQIYDNLGQDYVNRFGEIYPRIAADMNVPLIPFFLDNVGGIATLNQADAIHPTREGYSIIVNDNILPVLTPVLDKVEQNKNANNDENNKNKPAPPQTNRPTQEPADD